MNDAHINIYQAPMMDQRIARCRHSRLRAALQYRQPTMIMTETEPQEQKKRQDGDGPQFAPWERAALRLVKGMFSLLFTVASFISQPLF